VAALLQQQYLHQQRRQKKMCEACIPLLEKPESSKGGSSSHGGTEAVRVPRWDA
jgi:hypothetical protein